MEKDEILEYWNKGYCPMKQQAEDVASRFQADKDKVVEDFYNAYAEGANDDRLSPSMVLETLPSQEQRRYLNMYKNFYGLGKDALDDKKRNTYDATFEINDEYNIGIKNSKDTEKATIYFLDKKNKNLGYSYYAKTLADHDNGKGLYLDMGRDVKIDGDSMNEVARIAKAYAGIEDYSEDYEDEAALVRQTQELYDKGEIDEDEYERRMDFLL